MRTILLSMLMMTGMIHGATATFTWDRQSDPNVTNYVIYLGMASGNYTNTYNFGNVLQGTISNLVNGATYYATVTAQTSGGVESPFALEVVGLVPIPPTIQKPLENIVAPTATPVTLTLNATGEGLAYQWYKNGTPIPGAIINTLNFNSATWENNGKYYCIVTNIAGKDTSNEITVTIIPPRVTNFRMVSFTQ